MITPDVIIETAVIGGWLIAAEVTGIAGAMLLKGRWKLSTATARELAAATPGREVPPAAAAGVVPPVAVQDAA